MTTDGRQCFCGNGGSISCNLPNYVTSISNGKLNINCDFSAALVTFAILFLAMFCVSMRYQ